ncbi:hypothetical protein PCANC_12215 [Puccinia coronata f. sp. avenae]|uniref:Uncharacterized protein n=1 Tax=Puccinia coronata f. sp. avenae TaxID=200324 RepID=A0A2N5VEY9_9BASI|nr:hypothetical protein PCANC_12215 [Puccinia coronata f. sp. avenae]
MSTIKPDDSNTLKHQTKGGIFRRIFLSAKKTFLPSKTKLTRRPSSCSRRSKSKNALEDPFNATKPNISYPMKLHNSDFSFVTTQDPWEASVRSSGLHRRATVGTAQSHKPSMSCGDSRFSSCQPSQESKRLSFSTQKRISKDSISHPTPSLKLPPPEAVTPLNRSTCTVRPKSACQAKLSLEDSRSQLSHNHPFPPNRGSLCRHPPTRPLSLSHNSRRNSIVVSRNTKRSEVDVNSRRSSMASSNLTSTTSQLRQSWTTGRAVLEPPTAQDPGASCPARSSLVISGAEQKSISSYRRPPRRDWAGVIEEDITLTLMGRPQSPSTTTRRTSRASVIKSTPPPTETSSVSPRLITSPIPSPILAVPLSFPTGAPVENIPSENAPLEHVPSEDASSIPPSADAPSTTTSPSASSTFRSQDTSATPPFLHSSSTPSSTPSPPPSVRSISPVQPPRPLSLLFQSMGSSDLDGIDDHAKRGSDWFAELMTTVEQSISKLD